MKRLKNPLFYLILVALIANSCASNRFLKEKEKKLGTTGKYKWSFHRLSDRDKGVTLAFPGYIIGLEKSKRKLIGAPTKKQLKNSGALKVFGYNEASYTWDSLPFFKRMVLNDPRSTFVSAIIEYKFSNDILPRIVTKTHYDAYDSEFLKDPKEAFQIGLEELDVIGDKILQKIDENKITHVFMLSMGWNTDQQEALRNFNSLFLKIMDQAKASDIKFNPLFIGYTWASKWSDRKSNAVSLFTKSNDADEIGMTWFNYLLNHKLLSKKSKANFNTILIGHSLGAKLTSRATMSASMLKQESRKVDLLINLESAYSINRFSKNKGIEPTYDYEQWRSYVNNVALVWSEYDTAPSWAFWAPYAGGKRGHKAVIKHPVDYPDIELFKYKSEEGVAFTKPQQIKLIDASSIIYRDAYFKGGGAHSDIYNNEVAIMLWQLIVSSTFND